MKYFIYLLFILFFGNVNGQITIPATNLPSIGDTFVYIVDSTSLILVPSNTATTFNFSTLLNQGQSTYIYKKNDDSFTYPNANIMLEVQGNIANSSYFKKTANDLLIYGIGGLNGIGGGLPLPIPSLNGTLKFTSLPLTSTSNITSSDNVNVTLPASIFPPNFNIDSILTAMIGSVMGGAKITVDSLIVRINISNNMKTIGYGKITTPKDTNVDVLRVERTLSTGFTIKLMGKAKLGSISIPLNQDITTLLAGQIPGGSTSMSMKSHIYYSDKYKQEVFSGDVDTATNAYTNVMYKQKTTTNTGGHNSITSNLDKNSVNISISNEQILIHSLNVKPFEYTINSMEGKMISSGNVKENTIDISNLPSGMFILNLSQNNQTLNYKFSK